MNKYIAWAGGLLCAFSMVACQDKDEVYVERPATDLYTKGYKELVQGDYKDAAASFDEIERQHPYSEWATRGQLMAAYAHYLKSEYDKAVSTLDVFIQLHPGHKDVAYAYYLRSLCFYDRILGVARDQKFTYEALQALSTVAKKFPSTSYARDVQFKIDLVQDHLAGKELDVGRYYMDKKLYLGAINRFQTVVDSYQATTHVPEALHRLVECYVAVGLTKEAQTVAAVLGHNYPGNEWYADSYLLLRGKDLRPTWIKSTNDSWIKKLVK